MVVVIRLKKNFMQVILIFYRSEDGAYRSIGDG